MNVDFVAPGQQPAGPSERQPLFYDDLTATLTEAWRLLSVGASDRHSPFHTPSVATIAADGSPSVRTVVLRAVDSIERHLRFHTDWRSAKVAELRADSRLALLAYDPAYKVQLRLRCHAEIDQIGDRAAGAWAQSQPMSRACYRAPLGPGTPIASPEFADIPEVAHQESGRENFCTVICTVFALDWLYLAAAGHRRARFAWAEDGALETATWLAP